MTSTTKADLVPVPRATLDRWKNMLVTANESLDAVDTREPLGLACNRIGQVEEELRALIAAETNRETPHGR